MECNAKARKIKMLESDLDQSEDKNAAFQLEIRTLVTANEENSREASKYKHQVDTLECKRYLAWNWFATRGGSTTVCLSMMSCINHMTNYCTSASAEAHGYRSGPPLVHTHTHTHTHTRTHAHMHTHTHTHTHTHNSWLGKSWRKLWKCKKGIGNNTGRIKRDVKLFWMHA